MSKYFTDGSPRLKFFITTRPLILAHQSFDVPGAVVLNLEEDAHCLKHIGKDISEVVTARFDKFAQKCIQDPGLRQELLNLIRPKEDRTYLYVKLLFDCLDLRLRDGVPRLPRGWINVFKTLPTTVKEAYLGFLNRVRECHRDDVRRLFHIVVAAERPLTLRELNIALNIRDCAKGSKHGLGLQDDNSFRSWILDACKHFLDVYNGRVYFIHQTAKDFLLEEQDQHGPVKPHWLGKFTTQSCHKSLAKSCVAYLSLPLRTRSRFQGVVAAEATADNYHLWDTSELEFASYAHLNWHIHVQGMLGPDRSANQSRFINFLRIWKPWHQRMATVIHLSEPWSAGHVSVINKALAPDDGRSPWGIDRFNVETSKSKVLTVTAENKKLVILDTNGAPLPHVPPIPISSENALEKLTTALRSLTTFNAARSLLTYQLRSPVPPSWFSVRLSNKSRPSATVTSLPLSYSSSFSSSSSSSSTSSKSSTPSPWLIQQLTLTQGDILHYKLSNRTPSSLPAYVHMLSLNASWSVSTLLWNVPLPAGQEREGDLKMHLPHSVDKAQGENDDDDQGGNEKGMQEAVDTILVIFCVGVGVGEQQQCAERLGTAKEWLSGLYVPPVVVTPRSGEERGEDYGPDVPGRSIEAEVWPFFVPPPNWLVMSFRVRQSRGGMR